MDIGRRIKYHGQGRKSSHFEVHVRFFQAQAESPVTMYSRVGRFLKALSLQDSSNNQHRTLLKIVNTEQDISKNQLYNLWLASAFLRNKLSVIELERGHHLRDQ